MTKYVNLFLIVFNKLGGNLLTLYQHKNVLTSCFLLTDFIFCLKLSQCKTKSAPGFLHPVPCTHQAYRFQWVGENWELGDSGLG